ncbi:unnamed protein product [Lymnaea stagnalis]|uniref:SAYSvFN domain-containing protein n=1 Tax=Lymnaea stagnalis TaxID=6523 RepID=A0AAV2INW9_LYMST
MESKLAAYRARKAKEELAQKSLYNQLKRRITKLMTVSTEKLERKEDVKETPENNEHLKRDLTSNTEIHSDNEKFSEYERSLNGDSCDQAAKKSGALEWTLLALKIFLWVCLWGLFIELQFGAVFFTLSLLIFTYFNTRTGPKDNKPSAYSVFNKDCERIHGTLTAEQLQKQMFSVPGLPS